MSSHGATLQTFNNELVRSLESIKERRDNIIIEIKKEEERKNEIEKYLMKLKEELEQLDESLIKKYEIKDEFDKVINNTESAFIKLLESSQTLLSILKRDETHLLKRIKIDK